MAALHLSPSEASLGSASDAFTAPAEALDHVTHRRKRNIAAAIAEARAQAEPRRSGRVFSSGAEVPPVPHVDIGASLEAFLSAQLRHMVESAPKDKCPDTARLRALLAESQLLPVDITQKLEARLCMLCANNYPTPMPQSNRENGLGHSSVLIRDNMTRYMNEQLAVMLTTLRGGKATAVPKSVKSGRSYNFLSAGGTVEMAFADAGDSDIEPPEEEDTPYVL